MTRLRRVAFGIRVPPVPLLRSADARLRRVAFGIRVPPVPLLRSADARLRRVAPASRSGPGLCDMRPDLADSVD